MAHHCHGSHATAPNLVEANRTTHGSCMPHPNGLGASGTVSGNNARNCSLHSQDSLTHRCRLNATSRLIAGDTAWAPIPPNEKYSLMPRTVWLSAATGSQADASKAHFSPDLTRPSGSETSDKGLTALDPEEPTGSSFETLTLFARQSCSHVRA